MISLFLIEILRAIDFFRLDDHGLELIPQKKISTTNMLNLYNMIIIQGYNGLSLSSLSINQDL